MEGRLVYAFSASRIKLREIAKPSGPRPILISYHFLSSKGGLKLLEEWREYSQPHMLMLDSGVYTLRRQLVPEMTAMGKGVANNTYEQIEQERQRCLEHKDKIDEHTRNYIQFLRDAEGLWDYAIEMDVDQFMGLQYANAYYDQMCAAVPQQRIMRVWHYVDRTMDDWLEWCADPNQPYLALEGGVLHSRDPDFYQNFVRHSRAAGKKVHVLAMTVPEFLLSVDIDTTDSNSYMTGGMFGTVKIPRLGGVVFNKQQVGDDLAQNHYLRLSGEELAYCVEWFEELGYTLEDVVLDKNGNLRSLLNIFYYDRYVDKPYAHLPVNRPLF